jgi:hypothetical protein
MPPGASPARAIGPLARLGAIASHGSPSWSHGRGERSLEAYRTYDRNVYAVFTHSRHLPA